MRVLVLLYRVANQAPLTHRSTPTHPYNKPHPLAPPTRRPSPTHSLMRIVATEEEDHGPEGDSQQEDQESSASHTGHDGYQVIIGTGLLGDGFFCYHRDFNCVWRGVGWGGANFSS